MSSNDESDIKIEIIKKLIRKGDYNISEISEVLGFKRVSHFSYFFKSKVGLSPKKYELYEKYTKL